MPSLDTTPVDNDSLNTMRIANVQYVKDSINRVLKNYIAPTIHTFNTDQFNEDNHVISLKENIFDKKINDAVKAMWDASSLPNVSGALSVDNQYFKLTALKVLTFSDTFAQQLRDAAAGVGGNRSIKGNKLFSSKVDNRVLAVQNAGDDPSYIQINSNMIEPGAITADKISPTPIIRNDNIFDQTITGAKIDLNTITGDRLVDESISPSKLRTDEEYGKIVVSADKSSDRGERKVHNIIVSAEEPTNAQPGDIWFRIVE